MLYFLFWEGLLFVPMSVSLAAIASTVVLCQEMHWQPQAGFYGPSPGLSG